MLELTDAEIGDVGFPLGLAAGQMTRQIHFTTLWMCALSGTLATLDSATFWLCSALSF